MLNIIKAAFILINKLNQFASKRVDILGAPYVAFGVFGTINYPICYFMWNNVNPQQYESFTLRLIAGFLCLVLAFKNHWPQKLRAYLPLYWYITVLYTLPFFGAYMLLKNHASQSWLMNDVVGFFLLGLIVDWLSFAILFLTGVILGWLFFYLTADSFIYIASTDISLALYMYLFALILVIIFSRNQEFFQLKKRLEIMESVGSSIAHELRTPLINNR